MARRIFDRNLQNPRFQKFIYFLYAQIYAWHKLVLTVTIIVLAPVFIFASRHHVPSVKTSGIDGRPLAVLSGNVEYIDETEVVSQVPSSPKAVLFIAHGCHGRATFFWDKSPNCAECCGLPEDRTIVMHALNKGYAVVSISSTRECWILHTDKDKVLNILVGWIKGKNLEGLPVVALGVSSGGFFVSALAREYRFKAIVIMISEGLFHTIDIDGSYPPTLFVHMVKDKRRASLIRDAMNMLESKGVDTAEIKCYQLTVTPDYFTKIPGLDLKTSQHIQQVFREIGVLNNENLMTLDGRAMNWVMHLKPKQVMPDDSYYYLWDMHMRELLNLAYGYHEITSLQSNEMFEWLDAQLSKQVA